jgi:hypothetical protein
MYEKNGGVRLSIERITSPHQALHTLEEIAGKAAAEVSPKAEVHQDQPT